MTIVMVSCVYGIEKWTADTTSRMLLQERWYEMSIMCAY